MYRYLILACLLLSLLPASRAANGQPSGMHTASSHAVYYSNGQSFMTPLNSLKYLGEVNGTGKTYLILSGKYCSECDSNCSVYIHSPQDGPMKDPSAELHFALPGRKHSFESNEVIFESRAFYGEVLPGRNGVIFFQKYLNDKQEMTPIVRFVEVVNDGISESEPSVSLTTTIEQVFSHKAFELEAYEYVEEP